MTRRKLAVEPSIEELHERWRREAKEELRRDVEAHTPAEIKRLRDRLRAGDIEIDQALWAAINHVLAEKDASKSGLALILACREWVAHHAPGGSGKSSWIALLFICLCGEEEARRP